MSSRAFGLFGILAGAPPGIACDSCRPLVAAEIYNSAFLPTLLMLSLPVAILLFIAAFTRYFLALGADASETERTRKWVSESIAAP